MGSYPDEFPFGIMEVVELLHLRVRRQQANSVNFKILLNKKISHRRHSSYRYSTEHTKICVNL